MRVFKFVPNLVLLFVAAAVVALPFFGLLNPLLALAAVGLAVHVILKQQTMRATIGYSFWFTYLFIMFSAHWTLYSLFIEADINGLFFVPALLGAPVLIALPVIVFGVLLFKLKTNRWIDVVTFALLWLVVVELGRNNPVVPSFPVNYLGYMWSQITPQGEPFTFVNAFSHYFLQLASVVGVTGLTVITLVTGGLLYRRGFLSKGISLAIIVGWGLFGYERVQHYTPDTDVKLFLIQKSVPQREKIYRNYAGNHFLMYLEEMAKAPEGSIILLPESAIRFSILENPHFNDLLSLKLPHETVLLTGATYREYVKGEPKFSNSLLAFNSSGEKLDVYRKYKVMPYGEAMPSWIEYVVPKLKAINSSTVRYTEGSPPTNTYITVGTKRVSYFPLICYEALFPSLMNYEEKPDFLLNVSNDGWFIGSRGPISHYLLNKARAVEEGVPMVRIANYGPCVIVGPQGEERAGSVLKMGQQMNVVAQLPHKFKGNTLFSKLGGSAVKILLVVLMFCYLCVVVIVKRTLTEQ